MIYLRIAAALIGVLLALPAGAVTVTGSSASCLAVNNSRTWLTLDATGATANIGYCLGAGCTAAIGVDGTTTIPAGTLHYFTAGSAPKDAMSCISASGSQPLTIREGR
jgi:hypothetical protein